MSVDATKAESSTVIAWNKRIPLVTNVFIMKDMALAIGISCLVLLVLLLAICGGGHMISEKAKNAALSEI